METPRENNDLQTERTVPTPTAETELGTAPAIPEASVVKVPLYRRPITIAVVIAVLLFAGAGYYLYTTQYKNGGVVAMVNGAPIYADAYEENLRLMTESATAQGVDLSDTQIAAQMRMQALDNLIDNALLIGAAYRAGITVDDAAIETVYGQLTTEMGGAETLAARMAEIGLTESRLRTNIRERILIDTYVESVSEIESLTVSDEEIAAFMEANVSPDTELPPLEEIRPVIESQILSLKRQEIMEGIIQSLRTEAQIEVRI
jgi:hypothetical protein